MNSDWIERYISQFEEALGQNSNRADIVKELRSNLSDMLEANENADEERVKAVLSELGDPEQLAYSYMGKPFALISGRYFTAYKIVLKIVLSAVTLGLVISLLIGLIFENTGIQALEGALELIPAWLSAIGAVTLIFYFIEKSGQDVDLEAWSVEKLPELKKHTKRIALSEPVGGLIASTLFYLAVMLAPQLFKYLVIIDGVPFRIFNFAQWDSLIPLFSLLFVSSLLKNIVLLLVRQYGQTVALTTVLVDLFQISLIGWLILKAPLFDEAALATLGANFGEMISISHQKQLLLAVFVVIFMIEIVSVCVKSFRRGPAQ